MREPFVGQGANRQVREREGDGYASLDGRSTVTLRLRLTASPTAPRAARRGVVDGLALEGALAQSTALLVSEAVTNSVLHAGLEADDLVHVDAWRTAGCLRVEVCDPGRGLHEPSASAPREGGYGLEIIGRLAERWGVQSDGHTRVWFELAA